MGGTQERFTGKVAIVTGGAAGIGLATARRLAAEGARVVIGDVDTEALRGAEEELGDAAIGQRCDVRVESEVESLVSTAVQQFGGLDVAFANAGIGSTAAIVDIDPAEWMRVIEVNLLGPLVTAKQAGRMMPDGGSIVFTSSLFGVQPVTGLSAYCCSKAALAMLAQVAALEFGPRKIRVNAIAPGLVRTGLTEGMWLMPEMVGDFQENAPLGVFSTAEEVAALVAFLSSDEAASITGSLYLVDGGAHAKRAPDVLEHVARAMDAASD